MKATILVVDDDTAIREAVKIYLEQDNYLVLEASDGVEALELLEEHTIHLVVMDIMMPNMDGIMATYKIRQEKNVPILMLSAKSEEVDTIQGLQVGADDYLTKPFRPLELTARVKSLLRRYMNLGEYEARDADVLSVRGLSLNRTDKIVVVDNREVYLTKTEFNILELLMSHTGQVFSVQHIYESIWHETGFNVENTVSVHIRKIREKIEVDPKNPEYLKVVWGVGYKVEK